MTELLTDLWHFGCAFVLAMTILLVFALSSVGLLKIAIEMKEMLNACG